MADNEPIYDDPRRCVKDQPEQGPCSCPECKAAATVYIPKGIVITDKDLDSPEPIHRIAYHFVCTEPTCRKNNIADYMSYCPDCGTRVILRSHKVEDFLKRHLNSLASK